MSDGLPTQIRDVLQEWQWRWVQFCAWLVYRSALLSPHAMVVGAMILPSQTISISMSRLIWWQFSDASTLDLDLLKVDKNLCLRLLNQLDSEILWLASLHHGGVGFPRACRNIFISRGFCFLFLLMADSNLISVPTQCFRPVRRWRSTYGTYYP